MEYLPCESVLEILHTVPQARTALTACTALCSVNIVNYALYVDYRDKVSLIQDPLEMTDARQKHTNKYVDNHRVLPGMRDPT